MDGGCRSEVGLDCAHQERSGMSSMKKCRAASVVLLSRSWQVLSQ